MSLERGVVAVVLSLHASLKESYSIPLRFLLQINQPLTVHIVIKHVSFSLLAFQTEQFLDELSFIEKQNLKDLGLHNYTENKLRSEWIAG